MKIRQKKTNRSFPSALSLRMKVFLGIPLGLAIFMLANTLYLLTNRLSDSFNWQFFAAGKTSLPHLFQVMILTHTGVGLLLVTLFFVFAIAHLPKVWRRHHRSSVISGSLYVLAGLLLLITGLFIISEAASRDNRWAWWTHVVCAALAPAGYIVHRLVSYAKPVKGNFFKYFIAVLSVTVILGVMHGFSNRGILRTREAQQSLRKELHKGPGARSRVVSEFTYSKFVPAGFVPPASAFFPSAATTTTGGYLPSRIITRGDLGHQDSLQAELDKIGFVKNTKIGAKTCERCHADIVEQWAASAHRFASFNNPFYEATVQELRNNSNASNSFIDEHVRKFPVLKNQAGMVKSKWCSGCHDPALMLAGKMNQKVDRMSAEAQAGLTCLSCHAIDYIHNNTGNGNYNIADEQEDPYLFANAETGTIGAFLHDTALKAKPTVHKRQMQRPFFSTSEFCATCHKVSLTKPVNNYRWLRAQNEYDNWHDSGVALNASRTFYLPQKKRICQDCHMPPEPATLGDVAAKDGYVKSHRFLAVNTALPFLRNDQETIKRIEDFLRNEKLSVDIFALKTDKINEPIMAINHAKPNLNAGEKVTVEVVIRNKGVGHTFPGGTNDSNEGWLEFSLIDDEGKTLAISGGVGGDGHLDPMAHVFKSLILDKHGKPIHKRNAQDIHVTVFANVISPGTADIAHYEFIVPKELFGKPLTMRARLLWRKFDRRYTEFAFHANREGFKQFDQVPDLPITEIASDRVILQVDNDKSSILANGIDRNSSEWVRYNDYGIGLLLEGDTRGAANAFKQVLKLRPQSIEGPLNLAKTAVQDGSIDKAYDYLQRCEEIKSGDARVAWVWGVALQEDGQYEKAALAYKAVLEKFPEDRAAWRNLGRTFYLNQKYEQALEAFAELLEIDPEDRIGHYHRMLCYRALGREKEAEVAKATYEFYQIDESAQEITRAFKLKNPGANLMAQKIRTHPLTLSY